MARSHLPGAVLHLHQRAPDSQPFPVPDATIQPLPDLIPRGSTPTSSTTCGPNDNSGSCQKPVTQSSFTVPIAVGVAVPLGIALILFLFLHRRHVRKLRREDVNDKHKSLDFGLHPANNPTPGRKNKKALHPDIAMEQSRGRGRGMSMDLVNPYLLPPGLTSSHESLHSMSRTVNVQDDPYRMATDSDSIRSLQPSKRGGDDSSSYTAASSRFRQDGPTQNLIANAQRMPRSQPPAQRNSIGSMQGKPRVTMPPPAQVVSRKGLPSNPHEGAQTKPAPPIRDSYTVKDDADLRRSNNYLAGFIRSRDPSVDQAQSPAHQGTTDLPTPPSESQFVENRMSPPPTMPIPEESSRPPRGQSLASKGVLSIDTSTSQGHHQYQEYEGQYQDQHGLTQNVVPPSPELAHHPYPSEQPGHSATLAMPDTDNDTRFYTPGTEEPYPLHGGLNIPGMDYEDRRMSIMRPLPPDEPMDNPEQRANRIRSFYKEYFDDSQPARTYQPAPETYYEDYDQEYQSDGTTFDPVSGQFIVSQAPYAQPITRRAMTPPPRAPPRFQGPGRHQHNNSNPGSMMSANRSRAASSASTSARFGPQSRGPPKRALPPPAPLRTLPTPHLLQEDAFAVPIDFAPPSGYKDRQAGRPESPMMQMRPYSPSVRSHTPLASAFDELAGIPSPHQLRKSGAFTALDFAPPPRFKNSDSGSDAGSIRSGRSTGSAMSATQMHSLRAGAYRVSRIPKEVVGTKDEITNSLRPQWTLRP